ncbi:hypothetical protein ES708_07382 [subsurface metagenome]
MNGKRNLFLSHILDSCKNIIEFTKDIDFKTFINKRLIQSAVIRELEIIGEATKNVSVDIRENSKDIPWKKLAGMRDKLSHRYFTVDLEEVWNTSKNDIRILKKRIEKIINYLELEEKKD